MTTAEERQKMLDKIKGLAAMANPENGGTQGEIENAAKLMQTLMDKYNISMLEVMQEKKDDPKFFTSGEVHYRMNKVKAWHWSLARAIGRIVGVRHYSTSAWGKSDREKGKANAKNIHLGVMCFYGAKENITIAIELYDKWVVRIDDMATKATADYLDELAEDPDIVYRMRMQGVKQVRFLRDLGELHPQTFRMSWLDGCLSGIHTALWEQEKAREKEEIKVSKAAMRQADADSQDVPVGNQTTTTASAMVIYNANLDKAYSDFSSHFRKANTYRPTRSNYGAFERGHKVGKGINLSSKELKG